MVSRPPPGKALSGTAHLGGSHGPSQVGEVAGARGMASMLLRRAGGRGAPVHLRLFSMMGDSVLSHGA